PPGRCGGRPPPRPEPVARAPGPRPCSPWASVAGKHLANQVQGLPRGKPSLGESGVGREQLVGRLPHQGRRLRRGASSIDPGGSKRAIEQAVEVRHLLAVRSLRGLVVHAASSIRDSKSWSTRTY